MAVNPNEDTEFNDALRKHGIIPPREPTPPTPSPPPSPTFDDILNDFTPSELRELGEDAKDDETERMIDAHRRVRLADDKLAAQKARFGRVYPISREDYTREVTEASNIDEEDDDEEKGTGVVCFLYKDGIPQSEKAFQHVRSLAVRYPRTKFVSIVGDKCIPNLPDARIPMFIIYRKGDVRNQLVSWGADRERKIEELEAALILAGALDLPDRLPPKSDNDSSDNDDDIFDGLDRRDPSSKMRSATTSTNANKPKNIRSSSKDDGDSDFEFDL